MQEIYKGRKDGCGTKQDTRPPLIILTGPTAVGKTELSLKLAKAVEGEIISADSMQVYRHMDIGSAKLPASGRQGIPHYLIDIMEPSEEFNVVTFQKMAYQAAEEIYGRRHIPILVGGTGFYIQALLYGIDFTQTQEDSTCRVQLEAIARDKGNEYLHSMLAAVDREAAEQIHANNVKRTVRALEYFMQTGRKISEHNEKERGKEAVYNACYFVLDDCRERIYDRIDRRVEAMVEEGLVLEVKKLRRMGCNREMVSMQGLGYKEILAHLDGEYDLDRAVYLIKRDTRHFAKRQLTWFRRERDVIWVERPAFEREGCSTEDAEKAMLDFIIEECGKKGIVHGKFD